MKVYKEISEKFLMANYSKNSIYSSSVRRKEVLPKVGFDGIRWEALGIVGVSGFCAGGLAKFSFA